MALSSAFDAANFDLAIKALVLLFLISATAALWEVIRYVRVLRRERALAHRLTLHRTPDEPARNDPRVASAPRHAAAPGPIGRLARGTAQAVGTLTILVALAAALAAPFLGTWLEHQDQLEKADYIVPLPGDSQRLLKAAELYQQGFAPRVLLTRAPAAATERTQKLRLEAGYPPADPDELQLRTLEKAGVPRASTAPIEPNDATISATAEALKRYVEGRRAKVIVVASGIHAMRTRLTFEDAMPRSRVIVIATPDGGEPWWSSRDSAMRTLGEVVRVTHHWLGGGLRSLPTEPERTASSPANAARKPSENLGAGQGAR